MAIDRPDYTQETIIKGLQGVTLRTVAVDANGNIVALMTGNDAGTLRTVAVDANGKILGVLQGDDAGTLRTLAVDGQGRLLAVLTDPEDVFGNPHYMGAAELAVRLGSIDTFERRGQVILLDGFECGDRGWIPSLSGTLASVNVSTTRRNSGTYSLKLVGGSSANHTAQATRKFAYATVSRMGYELAFCPYPNLDYLKCSMHFYTGTVRIDFHIIYDHTNSRVRYTFNEVNYTDIVTSINLAADDYLFHHLKFVVDMPDWALMRVVLDNTVYNIAVGNDYEAGETSPPHMRVAATIASRSGNNDYVYIDDVIVTQSEP